MIKIFIYFILCIIISIFVCDIEPQSTYTWYSGIWHGLFFVPNFILSIFYDNLYKAESYSSAYNFFWWVLAIFTTIGNVSLLFSGFRPKSY
jgi:hypothetical protein